MIIEFEGANKVREVINRTEYLESYIPENDKTPVWDGFIMVYNNSKIPHAKKDIKGRVSVQVKGHKVEDFPDGNFKFPIELSDLKAFLTEGGAIFFVVAITQDYKKKVFHKVLLPLDIERIIQKHSDQQTVSIQFDPFPTDNGTIISIFLNFLANRSKQTSTVDFKKLFLEDWTRDNHNQTRNYTIPMTVFNDPDKTFFELITSIPQYLYITHEEFQHIQVPVDRMDNISIGEDRKGSIKVDNNEHYTEYKIVWHKGNFSFHFGKGLSMNFKRVNGGDEKNGYEVNVSLNIKGTLKERIRDVEFFLSYIENEEVSINTVKFPLHINYEMDIDKINSFNEIYKSLIDIQIKLNELDVSEDLDIDMLVDEEAWKLDELVRIGDKKKGC
ncbi:hypothetical protein [Marinilactibacillus psychrotolerans]|uniref:hypothetical protein n=1 Tax=Marinilactibacillus psychrotolerans TaxID=191770 RepID=UPI0038883553